MARRRRRRSTRVTNNYYQNNVRYSSDTPGGQPVLGSILQSIILFCLLATMVVTVGPLIDFFGDYVADLPAGANAYKEAVLPLYPWCYAFIVLVGIVGYVYIYRTVIKTIIYSRWSD